MKGISCNSNVLSDLPVEKAIYLLAEYGYDAIDICLELTPPFDPVPTPHMSPDDDNAKRKLVFSSAQKAGIAIATLNAHTNICARDSQARAANIQFLEGAVQLAADLETHIVVTSGGGKDAYGYEQWFFEWAVDTLKQVLPTANKLGITLAIEAGSPPGCLIYNIETMRKLLDSDGLDSVRVLFDPAHYFIRGDSPIDAFKVFSDQIVHMHAKDATGDPENIIFPPLGEGKIDFDALFGVMSSVGFDGYIAAEYEAFAWDFAKDHGHVLAKEKKFLDHYVAKYFK
mgnify:FL=1